MELVLPSSAVSDWHLVLHLGLYPEWSKLTAHTSGWSKAHPSPTRELFTPRILARPETEWDAIQCLLFGIDLLSQKLYG